MNKRLKRIKEEEETNRRKRGGTNRKVFFMLALCIAFAVFGGQMIRFTQGAQQPDSSVLEPVEDDLTADGEDWRLLIVSPAQILDRAFTVSLYEVEGKKVDVRIAHGLTEMLAAARSDGVDLTLCSTYRNVSTQRRLYERKVNGYLEEDYSEEEAKTMAGRYVQPPGASEHHIGLAVDFFTDNDGTLTEAFAKTDAYAWLEKHAIEYGFIERYPKDKEDATGIGWEPWHYRYVGKIHAMAMNSSGLCMEEYVAQLAGSQE